MNVLVYGGKGWIGSMFVLQYRQRFPDAQVIISDTRVNSSNTKILAEEIEKADRVVCMLGRTSGTNKDGKFINTIDYLEDHLSENVRDNLYAPLCLAKLCGEKHLFYLGTGCIFSWDTVQDLSRRVSEDEHPDFFGSAYSIVKGHTDDLMKLQRNVCNWRIRMPIVNYKHPKNFISKIVTYPLINNNYNSMTYLPNIIPIMVEMVYQNTVGTFNMTNPGFCSHSDILSLYAEHVDKDHTYQLVIGEKDLNLASKRSSNILSTDKLSEWCEQNGMVLDHIHYCIVNGLKYWKFDESTAESILDYGGYYLPSN